MTDKTGSIFNRNPERIAEMIELYHKIKSISKVSYYYDCDRSTISYHLHKNRIKIYSFHEYSNIKKTEEPKYYKDYLQESNERDEDKIMKREAKFQIVFKHWIEERWDRNWGLAAFELKKTPNDYFLMSLVRPHQLSALMSAKHGKLYYKPSDSSRDHKPCDTLLLCGAGAYVVIQYPEVFVLIDIDVFIIEKEKDKALSYKRAIEIAFISCPQVSS